MPPTAHSNRWYHSKHVEQFPDKINCVMLHLVGYILEWNNNFHRLLKFMERAVWMRLVFRHTVVLCNRTTDVKSWVLYKWLDVLVILFLHSVFTKHVFMKILSPDGISKNKTCFQPLVTAIIMHSVSLSAAELKGSIVGFSQYTANFNICIYLLYVTRTTCFGLSYFRPSSGPSITLLLAMPGVMWLFT